MTAGGGAGWHRAQSAVVPAENVPLSAAPRGDGAAAVAERCAGAAVTPQPTAVGARSALWLLERRAAPSQAEPCHAVPDEAVLRWAVLCQTELCQTELCQTELCHIRHTKPSCAVPCRAVPNEAVPCRAVQRQTRPGHATAAPCSATLTCAAPCRAVPGGAGRGSALTVTGHQGRKAPSCCPPRSPPPPCRAAPCRGRWAAHREHRAEREQREAAARRNGRAQHPAAEGAAGERRGRGERGAVRGGWARGGCWRACVCVCACWMWVRKGWVLRECVCERVPCVRERGVLCVRAAALRWDWGAAPAAGEDPGCGGRGAQGRVRWWGAPWERRGTPIPVVPNLCPTTAMRVCSPPPHCAPRGAPNPPACPAPTLPEPRCPSQRADGRGGGSR